MSFLRKDRPKASEVLKRGQHKNDLYRVEIRRPKADEKSPWVTAYKFVYEADPKGELIGQVNLEGAQSGDELALRLGRLLLENSPVVRTWFEKTRSGK